MRITIARLALRLGRPNSIEWLSDDDVLNSSRPRTVGCEINNTCNANCSFCGYGKGADGKAADPRDKGMLDHEVFRHTLQLYANAGGSVFQLGPILGENSVHPSWLEYIREARSYDNIAGVSSFTNGILLDRFGYRNVLESGLTTLTISTCLGSRRRYKEIYGVDQYDRVVANILGILRENKALGDPVFISLALRIDKPYERLFDSDLYREILTYLPEDRISVLEDHWDDFRGIIQAKGLPKGHVFRSNAVDKRTPCYALFRKLQVLKDGTIQACSCRVEPELWSGNIMDHDTLEAAWRNEELEQLRRNWQAGEIPQCCQECTHYIPYTNLVTDPRTVYRRALRAGARRILSMFSKA